MVLIHITLRWFNLCVKSGISWSMPCIFCIFGMQMSLWVQCVCKENTSDKWHSGLLMSKTPCWNSLHALACSQVCNGMRPRHSFFAVKKALFPLQMESNYTLHIFMHFLTWNQNGLAVIAKPQTDCMSSFWYLAHSLHHIKFTIVFPVLFWVGLNPNMFSFTQRLNVVRETEFPFWLTALELDTIAVIFKIPQL